MNLEINPGRSFPLGATVSSDGVNFSVFSKGGTEVELLLFGEVDAPRPERVIILDPRKIGPIITGTSSFPASKPDRFMLTGWRVPGPPKEAPDLTRGKSSWTLMAGPSRFLLVTVVSL